MATVGSGAVLARLVLAGLGLASLLAAQEPSAPPAGPAAPSPEDAECDALLARLVAPLQPELVHAAIHHPHAADSAAAQSLVERLVVQRGVAAAQGLLELTAHSNS